MNIAQITKKMSVLNIAMIVLINGFTVFGVFRLNWMIVDIFFWFYFEYLFTLIMTCLMLNKYWSASNEIDPQRIRKQKTEFIFSAVYITIFATIFLLLPVKGQLHEYGSFGNFISNKIFPIIFVICVGYLEYIFSYVKYKKYLYTSFEGISASLTQKSITIAILYGILMLEYYLSNSFEISLSKGYMFFMLVVLILGKILAEVFSASRFNK